MTKRISFLTLIAVLLGLPPLRAANESWLTDFPTAKTQAKKENKRLFVLFTGSDWCPNCKDWEEDIFARQPFIDYAKTNLVLVLVDFPEKKKLPKAQQRKNDALKDKFKAEEYPIAYVLDSNAKQIGSIKWEEGGPNVFMKQLESLQPSGSSAKSGQPVR